MKIYLGFFLLIGLPAVLHLPVVAQRPFPSTARRIDEINRQAEKIQRDQINRDIDRKNARKLENSKRSKLIKAQILEDLKVLQAIYNQIAIKLRSDEKVEPEFILKSSAELKKHAARLKKNLSLPEPEDDEKDLNREENTADMRKSLLTLCYFIYDFVTNPIFNQPIGLNIEQSIKARRDLEMILQLSELINKNPIN